VTHRGVRCKRLVYLVDLMELTPPAQSRLIGPRKSLVKKTDCLGPKLLSVVGQMVWELKSGRRSAFDLSLVICHWLFVIFAVLTDASSTRL